MCSPSHDLKSEVVEGPDEVVPPRVRTVSRRWDTHIGHERFYHGESVFRLRTLYTL